MKKVQKIFQKKILPNKANSHQNLSTNNTVDIPKNEISKRQVFQRYKKAWYAEINNQYESSDSSGSEIDDETGYMRMKQYNKLQHLRSNSLNSSNIFEYSSIGTSSPTVNTDKTCHSKQGITPERGKDAEYRPYFMKAVFDFLSYDINDRKIEVTICEGEIVKVNNSTNKKKYVVENIDGFQIYIPKAYLIDLSKDELLEILSDEQEEENSNALKKLSISQQELQESDLNKKCSNNSKKFDLYLEERAEKQSDNINKSQKTPVSEFVNRNFSSLTKYRSLTENLDKDEVLDREDQDQMFSYKIDPLKQRKTKPKGPIVFDQEIWIDGENANQIVSTDSKLCA